MLKLLTRMALILAPVAGAAATIVLFADQDVNSAQDPGAPAAAVLAARFPADLPDAKLQAPKPSAEDQAQREAQSVLRAVALSPSSFVAALDALAPPPPSNTPRPSRADAVFNDAQIASIKARLKITNEQQRHWTPVEEALRLVAWRQNGRAKASLEPEGLQKLSAVTPPLFEVLREDQRREVRMLANVIGWKT